MGRLFVALSVALVFCCVIWVVVPYNNFYFNSNYIADSNLPEIVVALLLLVILVINPLLRLLGPGWTLNRTQIALIASLTLFAAIIPSNGLMRMFPHVVVSYTKSLNENNTTAKIAANEQLPQELFVDPSPKLGEDGKVKTFETPVSDQYVDELYEDEQGQRRPIPWDAWIGPLAAWGMLIMAMWTMMLGLGGVVYPQWRERERLPFPLLNVYQGLIGDADDPKGRVLPPIFTSPSFWIAVIAVFLLHLLNGLNAFTQAVPSFPLHWNIGDYFSDTIFRQTTVALKQQWVFFTIVGVAYFIPNRYSTSVWGWVIFNALYVTFGRAYIPAFDGSQINHQTFGIVTAIITWTIWLGRDHWYKVGKAMLGGRGLNEESVRDSVAGWMFVVGSGGMIVWFMWLGVPVIWSVTLTVSVAMVSLFMARVIAETGIPAIWISRFSVGAIMGLFPLSWLSPSVLFANSLLYPLVTRTTAVSASVITTLSLGMDRNSSPAQHTRILIYGLGVLAIGFVVCATVHINMAYSTPIIGTQGKGTDPKADASSLNQWERAERQRHSWLNVDQGHRALGFAVGLGLLWACSRFPWWPIHPVGILLCQLSIGFKIWFSIFLGWLIKVAVTSLFGGGAYRKARPVFLGLIIGELLAVVLWTLVPVIMSYVTNVDPTEVPRYELFRYP